MVGGAVAVTTRHSSNFGSALGPFCPSRRTTDRVDEPYYYDLYKMFQLVTIHARPVLYEGVVYYLGKNFRIEYY